MLTTQWIEQTIAELRTVEHVAEEHDGVITHRHIPDMSKAAECIAAAAEEDKADALSMQDAAWHEIEEQHLGRIEELEAENGRLHDDLDDCKMALEGISDYVKSIPERQRDDALETVLAITEESLAVQLSPRRFPNDPNID